MGSNTTSFDLISAITQALLDLMTILLDFSLSFFRQGLAAFLF